MPTLATHDKCCGCASCANKCTREAITMLPNNEGFLHPTINTMKCIECGLCEKVCPGIFPIKTTENSPCAFVVQHKDDEIRRQSTSGGAFTAIAEYVIQQKGVVFGAVMTKDFKVKHIDVSELNELSRFRNSKYVQSEIGDCYKKTKKYLIDKRLVCFSGTPCQINGLHKYLGREYENLITVDVVCKSVPSPLIFKKYVEFKQQKEGQIGKIVFRDKKREFHYCTMAHYSSNEDGINKKAQYRRGSESDEWLRLFLSGKISRESCFSCHYQTRNRVCDFTLGDIWETGDAQFDDNKGCTLLHVWSQKGKKIIKSISRNIRYIEYPIEKSRGVTRKNKVSIYKDRNNLFQDVYLLSPETFFSKYAPYNLKIKVKEFGRYFLYKVNLQSFVRHLKHIIIHR